MIGINPDFDYLYDPQQRRPDGRCPECGSEIWGIGHNLCSRCRRHERMRAISTQRDTQMEEEDG